MRLACVLHLFLIFSLVGAKRFDTPAFYSSLHGKPNNVPNKYGYTINGRKSFTTSCYAKDNTLSTGSEKITKKEVTKLGILRIDYDYEPALGDIDHSGSFNYPVHYRVVPGLTFELCQKGTLTEEIRSRLKTAIKYLEEEKGVSAFTGDCGFMLWYQPYIREITRKPVFLSALTQIPSVLSFFGLEEQILIMTANGKSLEPMRDLIREEAGVEHEKTQFVIAGCENTPTFGPAVAQGLKVPVEKCIPEVVGVAKAAIKENKLVRAIVLECTELPPYANSIRDATGLPVYDSITNANFAMAGISESRNFGVDYMDGFDGKQESYEYGQNLTDEEKEELEFKEAE